MKTLLPYHPSKVRGETIRFLIDHVRPQDQVWLNCEGDDYAYFKGILDMWRHGEGFIILEHDVVPTTDQWDSLLDCNQPWCQQGYGDHRYSDEVGYGWIDNGHPGRVGYPGSWAGVLALGCTKFSERWVQQTRDRVLAMKPTIWSQLDSTLFASFPYGPPHYHCESYALHIKPGVA